MIINPKKILENAHIIPAEGTKCQQCGVDVTVKETVTVEPHGFQNIEIAEKVAVPENAAGFLFVRSSLSRKGIFISSGIYDPGFSGASGCTIYNMGNVAVTFEAGDRIAQMVFFECSAASQYNGKYQGSTSGESKGWK
mgnify:CR=1 FL=1